MCENCGSEADIFCKQCDFHYCTMCSTARHKHPARKTHILTVLRQRDSLPLSHEGKITGLQLCMYDTIAVSV